MTEPNGRRPKRRRRRGGRHTSRATDVAAPTADGHDDAGRIAARADTQPRPRRSLPILAEFSAGGLVIDGMDGPRENLLALLIGRADRRGRMIWMLPKGHIEVGETAEQTAMREIAEETGIQGHVLAALGSIDFWFRAQNHVVHKTVHHYLLHFRGGEPRAGDHEVESVEWVPFDELPSRLTHADERKLTEVAASLIDTLRTDGPAALPPLPHSRPRRLPQTHSVARHHDPGDPAARPGRDGKHCKRKT